MAQSRDQYPTANEAFKSVLDRLDILETDMTKLQGEVRHMATKADVSNLRTEIEKAEKRIFYKTLPAILAYMTAVLAVFKYLL